LIKPVLTGKGDKMNRTDDSMLEMLLTNKHTEVYPEIVETSIQMYKKKLSEEFIYNLANAGGICYNLDEISDIKPMINLLYPDADIIYSATPEIEGYNNKNNIITQCNIENADTVIIRAEFGVAETGMIWISEKSIRLHSLDFFSKHLIILLHPDSLLKDMHEAYEEVYLKENTYGRFIQGPLLINNSEPFKDKTTKTLAVFYL